MAPVISATAPGRCGIVGNPSDMYGGAVLSITTAERACCTVEPSERLTLAVEGGPTLDVQSADDLELRGDVLDIARAALTWFGIAPGQHAFRLVTSTRIPMQAGMAGSTALVVAVVGALNRCLGWGLHPWAIAEEARKVEYRVMKVVCGFQDQHMAVFGGVNFMDFRGKESLEQAETEPLATVEPLHALWPHETVPLVLAHTGVPHNSGAVHATPRQRWLAGDPAVVEGYARVAELAPRAKRAWLARDWPALGALMNENHAVVAGLGGSGETNERLIEAAREAGACGAKLAGAGGGGTIVALTEEPDRVADALRQAGAERIMRPVPGPGLTITEG